MNKLVIAALRGSAGKTSLIVGLSKASGKSIGYIKPFGDRLLYSKKRLWDYDAALIADVFSIAEEPETMSIGFDHSKLRYMYNEDTIREKVVELAAQMSAGKDILMVEGGKSITYGHSVHLDALSLARYLNGQLLFMIGGDDDTILDDIMFLKKNVDLTGIDLTGIIVNKVHNVRDFREVYIPELTRIGIRVMGVIPYERAFTYFSLRYLADKLFAKVLTAEHHLDRKIKNIVIGAMSGRGAQNKPSFRKEDRLIITGGDRSDMIVAALETDAVGIIITNNNLPPSNIISMAEERGTPLLLVNPDTYQVQRQIEQLEPLLTKDDPAAIELLTSLIREHVDLAAIGVS